VFLFAIVLSIGSLNAQTQTSESALLDDSDVQLAPCERVNNIKFKLLNPTTVNLTWDAVPGSTSYYIGLDPNRTTTFTPPNIEKTTNSLTLDYRNVPDYIYGNLTTPNTVLMIRVNAVCGSPNSQGPINGGAVPINLIREMSLFFPKPSDYNIDINPLPGNIIRYQLALAQWQNSWLFFSFP
jgi:hypothetical protein